MDGHLALVRREPQPEPLSILQAPPIAASYNDRIRPLLDAVDKLRNLMVMKEGIPLPTIVVVGDQSSGKSSVLESLAGVSLPRGQGICTRVPLIMRLQDRHRDESPDLHLEFNGKIVEVDDEDCVSDAIVAATDEIAGAGKGISNAPLTLVVKKDGIPDLTMVDLPGITRVPVHGQPENIYEQISGMIMEYIRPEESIILNVLSAAVDFSTCESIRMSRVDGGQDRQDWLSSQRPDYTCNPQYMLERNKLMSKQNEFMDVINRRSWRCSIDLEGIGEVYLGHLRDRKEHIQEAFNLKMRITAYWKIVLGRLVDSMALHLMFDVQNLVNSEMEAEIVGELIGPDGDGIQRMLEEAPLVAAKRDRLNRSVRLLRESAAVVAKIMDRIDCRDYND